METQNYKNHRKFVVGYHVVSLLGILALIKRIPRGSASGFSLK